MVLKRDGDDELGPLTQLVRCQSLESLLRVLLSTNNASIGLYECFGRIAETGGGIQQLLSGGISQDILETLRAAHRIRENTADSRSVARTGEGQQWPE